MCLLHQKPLDVICMEDFNRICGSCALFGEHKSHLFESVHEIKITAQKKDETLHSNMKELKVHS